MRQLKYFYTTDNVSLLYYLVGDYVSGYGIEIVLKEGADKYSRSSSGSIYKEKAEAYKFLTELYEEKVYPVHLKDILDDNKKE